MSCVPVKDWAKPGPYDQSMAHTLKRSRDRREAADLMGEEPQGVRGHHSVMSPKVRQCLYSVFRVT